MTMISQKFTIKDIHAIRYANYERTKNMTKEELINDSKKRAEKIKNKLEMLKKEAIQNEEGLIK